MLLTDIARSLSPRPLSPDSSPPRPAPATSPLPFNSPSTNPLHLPSREIKGNKSQTLQIIFVQNHETRSHVLLLFYSNFECKECKTDSIDDKVADVLDSKFLILSSISSSLFITVSVDSFFDLTGDADRVLVIS